jgi:hypothetical protein
MAICIGRGTGAGMQYTSMQEKNTESVVVST